MGEEKTQKASPSRVSDKDFLDAGLALGSGHSFRCPRWKARGWNKSERKNAGWAVEGSEAFIWEFDRARR